MSGVEYPRVTLVPGDGVVIRTPAFFCVVAAGTPEPVLAAIAGIESDVETPDGVTRRGRHLVRAIAQLVATADDDIDMAFAATDRVGIAAFLNGRVFAEVDGRRIEPGPGTPFDRALPWSHEGFGLYLAGITPAEPGRERFDLVRGVVPAAGALLHVPVGLRSTQIVPDTGQRGRLRAQPARSGPVEQLKPVTGSVTGELPVTVPLAHERPPASAEAPASSSGPEVPPGPEVAPETAAPAATEPWAAGSPREPGDGEPATDDLAPARADPGPSIPAPQDPPAPDVEAPVPAGHRPGAPTPPVSNSVMKSSVVSPSGATDHPGPTPPGPGSGRAAPTQFDGPYVPVGAAGTGYAPDGFDAVTDVAHSRPMAYGIRCPQGHLNHPDARWCAECRQPLALGPGVLVKGERPALGRLILDQGTEVILDETLILGRLTGSGQPAPQSTPKLVQVRDDSGLLSRKHVEFRLVEWTVQILDLHSANGTYVSSPSTVEIRLAPGRPHVLVPGARIRVGGRTVMFESAYVIAG